MYGTRMAFPVVERETKSATFLSFAYWMKNSDEKQKNKVMLWKDIQMFFHPNLLYYGLLIVNLNVIFFSSRKQLYCTKGRERKGSRWVGTREGAGLYFFPKRDTEIHLSLFYGLFDLSMFNSYILKREFYAKLYPSETTKNLNLAGP